MNQLTRGVVRLGVAASTVVAVLMAVGGSQPIVETGTNFRPHLLVATLPLAVATAAMGDRRALAATMIPIGVLSFSTVPYLLGGATLVPEGAPTLRVLQYNVLYQNDSHAAIIDEIRQADADVIALHELTTAQWRDIELAVGADYPYRLVEPVDLSGPGSKGVGKALLSRTPLTRAMVDSDYPNPPLAATTDLHGQNVLAIALHPSPARTNDWLIEQRRDKMAATIRAVKQHDGPAMIITDLNIAPTSPDYRNFLSDLGWDDPRRAVGLAPTFPSTGWAAPFGIAIDHVLVSPELTVHSYQLGDGGGSDHHSLVATISFPASE